MPIKRHLLKRSQQLRKKQTAAENRLWSLLRDRQLGGYKFRRQHVLFSYIVDFFCYAENLIVELDGPIHKSSKSKEYDSKRDAFLKANGFRILRFTNKELFENEEDVLKEILRELDKT